jgi:hypothetical protein
MQPPFFPAIEAGTRAAKGRLPNEILAEAARAEGHSHQRSIPDRRLREDPNDTHSRTSALAFGERREWARLRKFGECL